jgi:alkylation response protein AidB-like acyl-CoA dehydrogenase
MSGSTEFVTAPRVVPHHVLEDLRAFAGDVDRCEVPARRAFGELARVGLLDLGAPHNAGGQLVDMARVISALSMECMSTAFAVWANRMTLEYLLAADTSYALKWLERIRRGEILGITAMAAAFRELAGCGRVEIRAVRNGDGFVLDGPIRWATNLYDDSLLVTSVSTDRGEMLVVALPLSTPGVTVGEALPLLALGSTASSSLNLDRVRLGRDQILTTQFQSFLTTVRPTFLVLQTALCVGLATKSLAEAGDSLTGVNSVFQPEVETLRARLAIVESGLLNTAAAVASDRPPDRRELLSLRLAGAELATAAAAIEVKTAGGKGYASGTPASRRFREAAFIPIQSPSEAQLRWELAACTDGT